MSRKRYSPWRSGPLAWALETLPGKFVSHWVFQGTLNMDRTERTFKLGLDGLFALAMFPIVALLLPTLPAVVAALLLAHTLNVVVNGQLMVLLKFHRHGGRSTDELRHYLSGLGLRLGRRRSVAAVSAYGSLSRGAFHVGSDLDVAVLRRPGLRNGLDACVAVAFERCRALCFRVPLDIYVWDSPARAARMRRDEIPVDVLRLAAEPPGQL
jgi:predicted nucleotidyltransferase